MISPSRFLITLALLAVFSLPLKAADTDSEIESLLASIKNLQGATFIRNGESHTPVQAEDHLRMKWKKAGAKVKTAEDFITLCATKSMASGKIYLIRTADGKETEAGKFFTARLAELRSGKK